MKDRAGGFWQSIASLGRSVGIVKGLKGWGRGGCEEASRWLLIVKGLKGWARGGLRGWACLALELKYATVKNRAGVFVARLGRSVAYREGSESLGARGA